MKSEKKTFPFVLASIRLEKVNLSWLEEDIFKIEVNEGADLTAEDIKAMQAPKAEMTQNKKHFVLFVAPHIGNISKEAREFSARPEANVNATAKAIITPNLGMRLLTNFFIRLNKPPVPHKAFSDELEAFKWMMDLKKVMLQKKLHIL